MELKFVFLGAFLCLLVATACTPRKTVYGYEGGTITITCTDSKKDVTKTVWTGPPNSIRYFINNRTNTEVDRAERLSVILNRDSNAYDLNINDLKRSEDRGNYSCVATTPTTDCDFLFSLEVYIGVKKVTLIPSANPLTIREGIQSEVQCRANSDAFPDPAIAWYLDSKFVTSTNKYSIIGKREDNRKTLECKASNDNKTEKSANTTLNIEFPPTVNTLSDQNIIEGRDLSVTCEANPGNPNSTRLYWTKVDDPVFKQEKPSLQLPNIQKTSSGTYRCTAQNIYSIGGNGSDSQSMKINVYYPPTVNTLSQQKIIEGKDLSVTCKVTPGNPNSSTFYWTKEENQVFRQNGQTLQLTNINRNDSGTYRCTAENSYSNGEMGTHNQTMVVDVLYPPAVNTLYKQKRIEGRNLSVTCKAAAGNPSSTTFYWTKEDDTGFRQNGSTLQLPHIQRTNSGTYICTAENSYSIGGMGTHNQTMVVDVLYKPEIVENNHGTVVNENEQVTLYRQIISNPLSNVSWYNGSDLLDTQWSVKNATFNIENATCTDTKNYTLLANNGVQENVTALVELIVNCKPRSYKTNFTLGVTDTTGVDFSTFVIAYPEPSIKLEYENGTESSQMMKSVNRNAVNNFTIHIGQTVVNQSDFGVYHLKVWNFFGKLTVIVNVIAQRKPNVPVNIGIVCEETRAKVQWKSSFNGGDPQLFTVIASSGQQSINISDKGENVIHSTFVQHLQPSTMYVFYVSAQNSHGFILSEKNSCTTLAESSDRLPIIVGSAAAGGLTLVVILVAVVFLFRRYTNTEKQTGTSQRFENDLVENESIDDDGLKDNILYVSADPRENEKHEAAVYAAVNKSDPMSNNNSNVYAEVKKNGLKGVKEGANYSDVKQKKGFFKTDGKVKKEKRQKRKQEVADVYENSDDIAMTANPDNVYSNTNHNNDSAKEQRGYKNKDGLLYVEVQFDTKTEDKNPVIHGDDEKTDYATVEFPVPSSSHDRE